MSHADKRFYREGRKVMDREKSSHGSIYCEARSGHAAEIIQHALNEWIGMGPTRTPKMTPEDYRQLRRLKRMIKPAEATK